MDYMAEQTEDFDLTFFTTICGMNAAILTIMWLAFKYKSLPAPLSINLRRPVSEFRPFQHGGYFDVSLLLATAAATVFLRGGAFCVFQREYTAEHTKRGLMQTEITEKTFKLGCEIQEWNKTNGEIYFRDICAVT